MCLSLLTLERDGVLFLMTMDMMFMEAMINE